MDMTTGEGIFLFFITLTLLWMLAWSWATRRNIKKLKKEKAEIEKEMAKIKATTTKITNMIIDYADKVKRNKEKQNI